MENGQGLARLIPPLAQVDYLENNRVLVPCIIRNGMSGVIQVNGIKYNHPMPGNLELTSNEIANIIDFIFHAWGNDIPRIERDSISLLLSQCDSATVTSVR